MISVFRRIHCSLPQMEIAVLYSQYLFFFSSAQYFASTMMIVGLSVVVTVLVLQFHHHDPHGGKMPKWVG